jgi:hypothetical protein
MGVALRTEPVADGMYALAGEKVYCGNGCHIGTFVSNAPYGREPNCELAALAPAETGMTECPHCGVDVHGCCYYFADGSAPAIKARPEPAFA